MLEGFETIDKDVAEGHMTENGEPMTADDRCLRLEQQMKDMRTRVESLQKILAMAAIGVIGLILTVGAIIAF